MRDILVDENIFRLTKDVVNPLFDKRNKHGVESIKELKAGHTILSKTYSDEGYLYNEYVFFLDREKYWIQDKKFTKKLDEAFAEYKSENPIDASVTLANVAKEPKSITAALLLSQSPDLEEFFKDVVERLVSEGKISPNDLLEAYKRQQIVLDNMSDEGREWKYKELEKEIV